MANSKEKIWLASPHMSEEGYEQMFIDQAFESNWIAPLGPNVEQFESEVATFVGMKHAVALSSGTASIHLALKASGVGEGDIVLCQSFTFSATANPIIYERAIPVFIDSDLDTWNMDPKLLEAALKRYGKRVKAVIVVHLYGLPANLDAIVELCSHYDVTLIEDAAESFGSYYKGKHTGTFGKYGIFSFNGNKIITTSSGGMIVSDDEERLQKIKFWATQSRDKAIHYEHSEIGYNYRMSNLLAGVGRGQLKIIERRVKQKQHIYEFYKHEFSDIAGIGFMPSHERAINNRWLSTFTFAKTKNPIDVVKALYAENIEARPVWKPLHMQPVFRDYDVLGGRVSQSLFEHGLCLPSDTKLSDDDLARISLIVKAQFK